MSDISGGDQGEAGPVASVQDDTEVSLVQIEVNGVTIEVTKEVVVHTVLEKAKDAGCIEGAVDEYVIEKVSAAGELSGHETIVVEEHQKFLAVPTGKTDVA